jgi:tetratricopeptide (TPR) repeat protein
MRRACALFSVVAGATYAAAVTPSVLIVQEVTPIRYGQNFDVRMSSQMSVELLTEGRVNPIMWSLTDPMFRAAVEDKIIGKPSSNPKLAEALEVAVKLKAEYVLWIKAVRNRNQVDADVKLYRADKEVWKDTKKLTVTTGDVFDPEVAAASLARTWCLALGFGPFKDFPTTRRDTPDMDPGRRVPVVVPDPPRKVDNKQLVVDAAALAKAGQTAQLIVLLRDAVDDAPLDPGRRRLLIDYLLMYGHKELAAEEAKRSAVLLPESAEFHALAARSYMESGDAVQAQAELNEAIAREPESFDTRLLMGELSLTTLDVKSALEHLNTAIAKSATPDALFKRALANALAGEADSAKKDYEACTKEGEIPEVGSSRYAFVVNLADKAIADTGDKVRALIQTARLKKGDAGLATEAQSLWKMNAGITQMVGLPSRPERHATSHDLRVLALNLLAQCIAQVETSIKDKDADSLAEATMNLGEALKQSAAAKDAYQSELQKPAG